MITPIARCLLALGLFAAALSHAGCAPADSDTRIVLPQATINGRTVRAILDSGSSYAAFLNERAARRLGLRLTPTTLKAATAPIEGLYDSASLTIGSATVTAQFPATTFAGLELAVGWPAVRDNLLDFNGSNRTVTVLKSLPADLTGWVKLKIGPKGSGILYVEIPLTSGPASVFMVDTGDPDGIALPQDKWKEWRTAHPEASITKVDKAGVAGEWTVEESEADQLVLGPLAFTHVPVRELGDGEADPGEMAPNFAGVIGLGALARVELMTDDKNTTAYVRPLSVPVPGRPAAAVNANADWTFDGPVPLKGAAFNLDTAEYKFTADDYPGAIAAYTLVLAADSANPEAFEGRGDSRDAVGDYPGAIADYTRALELDPKNAAACIGRGFVKAQQGDFPGALADSTHAIELLPDDPTSYEGRAVDKQIQGDLVGAQADYDRVIQMKGDKSNYMQLYRHVLQLQQGTAPFDFAQTVESWKDSWAKSIGGFLMGKLDEKALFAAAATSDKESVLGQNCEACYFAGVMRLHRGEEKIARDYFAKAIATQQRNYYEYAFAVAELQRLDAAAKK